MAKTKTPFFSLGAHGSVGEAITAQKRGTETLLREKPLPTDPYSLPQAYQRWYYRDIAYRWTQQTAGTKQQYATGGVRFHLTGFQYWMKVQLPLFTNIAAWWTLDEKAGAVAYDRTPNNNNAAIFGASPITGVIDGAFHFDGVNDYLRVLDSESLHLTTHYTFEFWLKCSHVPDLTTAWGEFLFYKSPSFFMSVKGTADNKAQIKIFTWGGLPLSTTPKFEPQQWNHFVHTYDHITMSFYLNGALFVSGGAVGSLPASILVLLIGQQKADGKWFYGDLDNVYIYSRALDATEVKRHSERRYPS